MKKVPECDPLAERTISNIGGKKIYDDCGDLGLFPDHVYYAPCVLADSSFRETEHRLGEYAGTSRL